MNCMQDSQQKHATPWHACCTHIAQGSAASCTVALTGADSVCRRLSQRPLRKTAETASAQASALPSGAVSQDVSLATGAAPVAAADGAQPEVASPPAAAVPDLAAAEGGAAALAVTEALPAPQPAPQVGQAAEPMQIDTAAAGEGIEQGSAAAAEETATQAASHETQPGDPAAANRLNGQNKALQAADMAATPGGGLSLDKQLLGARSRSDPLDSSKGAPLVGKEAPSASAPIGDSGSLDGASLQEAEQANGKTSPQTNGARGIAARRQAWQGGCS